MASEPVYEDDFAQPPPKKGMSTGTKVLIIVLCVFGGLMLLCCGGVIWFVYQFQKGMEISEDSEVVKQRTQEIVEITIPDNYVPKLSAKIDFPKFWVFKELPSVSMIFYQRTGNTGSLVLIRLLLPEGQEANFGPADRERFQRDIKKRQGGDQQGKELQNEQRIKSITRRIRGKDVRFDISKGRDSESRKMYYQVAATIPGKTKNSAIFFTLQIQESEYKEAEATKIIESIK